MHFRKPRRLIPSRLWSYTISSFAFCSVIILLRRSECFALTRPLGGRNPIRTGAGGNDPGEHPRRSWTRFISLNRPRARLIPFPCGRKRQEKESSTGFQGNKFA